MKRIKVVALIGFGRSGSTLIDNVLGQHPKIFSVGELRHIWERGLCGQQLCGCNKQLSECRFWSRVLKLAFGESYDSQSEYLYNLAKGVDAPKFLPSMMVVRTQSFKLKMEEYIYNLSKLYFAISEVLGEDVTILDSSKTPSHVYLMSKILGIELNVIHVVRDPRAVAYSWSRSKLRPEIRGESVSMPKYSAFKSAVWWSGANLASDIVRALSRSSTILYYEDFAKRPKKTVAELLAIIGQKGQVEFINDSSLLLKGNHTVAGNPSRFKKGLVDIRQDVEWKSEMGRLSRFIVTLLTFPVMKRYGY